jgi:hypothetical protein
MGSLGGRLRLHEGVHPLNEETSSAFIAARHDLLSSTS